jgi:hypothetical protein
MNEMNKRIYLDPTTLRFLSNPTGSQRKIRFAGREVVGREISLLTIPEDRDD